MILYTVSDLVEKLFFNTLAFNFLLKNSKSFHLYYPHITVEILLFTYIFSQQFTIEASVWWLAVYKVASSHNNFF